jgi:uncharacterized RDD family membrane protein YckC
MLLVSGAVLLPLLFVVGLLLPVNGRGSLLLGGIALAIWVLTAVVLQYYYFVVEPRARRHRERPDQRHDNGTDV